MLACFATRASAVLFLPAGLRGQRVSVGRRTVVVRAAIPKSVTVRPGLTVGPPKKLEGAEAD